MHHEEFRRAFEQTAGTWAGCDWPTRFGTTGLDLNGWTADRAEARAEETTDGPEAAAWRSAAEWLAQVELHAEQAEIHAAVALAAADAGDLDEALDHAHRACALEEEIGRPAQLGSGPIWQQLYHAIERAIGVERAATQATAGGLLLGMERVLALFEVMHAETRALTRRVDRLECEAVRPHKQS